MPHCHYVLIDPLLCPKCGGQMRLISLIEEDEIIEKILRHLDLWEGSSRCTDRGPPLRLEREYTREPFDDDLPFGPDSYAEQDHRNLPLQPPTGEGEPRFLRLAGLTTNPISGKMRPRKEGNAHGAEQGRPHGRCRSPTDIPFLPP